MEYTKHPFCLYSFLPLYQSPPVTSGFIPLKWVHGSISTIGSNHYAGVVQPIRGRVSGSVSVQYRRATQAAVLQEFPLVEEPLGGQWQGLLADNRAAVWIAVLQAVAEKCHRVLVRCIGCQNHLPLSRRSSTLQRHRRAGGGIQPRVITASARMSLDFGQCTRPQRYFISSSSLPIWKPGTVYCLLCSIIVNGDRKWSFRPGEIHASHDGKWQWSIALL